MSLSWSATALSLILAMRSDKATTSAFAPSPTLGEKTSSVLIPPQSQFPTSIQFRYTDNDELSASAGTNTNTSHSHTSRSPSPTSRRRTPTATNVNASAVDNEVAPEPAPFNIETFFPMNIPTGMSIRGSGKTSIGVLNNDNIEGMPSWLRPSGVMADGKLNALRAIMRDPDSYLAPLEGEQVISAIRGASNGNPDVISGAVDFCLVLVETMEMGVATLIAAAYHYCDAYDARQQSALSPTDFSHTDYWNEYSVEEHVRGRAIKIGQDADQIIIDAGKIKRAEMVASASLKSRPSKSESASICKMLLSETHDWRALAIRSAACLYRLRGIYEHKKYKNVGGYSSAYSPDDIRVAREALGIHAPLASRLGMHRLKNEIEGAAFRILYRRQFDKVTELTHLNKACNPEAVNCVVSSMKDGMRLVLDTVTEEVNTLLRKDPCFSKYVENYKVTARIKEPYSLWRKMLALKATSIFDVPDALALRVVFNGKKMKLDEAAEVTRARETALCYYVQQMCTTKFKPLRDGRFKNYVANPKPNGYQSLHYTAVADMEGDAWPFEIQCRSREMHQVAEFGLAAHWDYKGQGQDSSTTTPHYAFELDNCSDAYLRSVQEWHWQQAQSRGAWHTDSNSEEFENDSEMTERLRARDEHLAPYLDALMKDHSNLAREHVFIFMSCNEDETGQILELPAGACILDALRESERTFGFTSNRSIEKGIIYNGSQSSVTQQLRNGDIISIPVEADALSP
jgi:ppGpp synthetase/RelA/SpoT-type nucleotidyltranferase